MKDSLFEMLMTFFEKTFSKEGSGDMIEDTQLQSAQKMLVLKAPKSTSLRVFSESEVAAFTKASYQLLVRLSLFGVILPEDLELIVHQLMCSDSMPVTLSETKWVIRTVLDEKMSKETLQFIELLLQPKDEALIEN